ncbi:ATP-binding cassette domain-containing protein [Cupriavidus basilensis]
MTIQPSLASRGIAKAFTVGKITQQVIKDSSLEIYPAALTLIVGPSGSGKSTMLSMMSGLLRPDTGQVFALDTELWTLDEAALDRFRLENCGFVSSGLQPVRGAHRVRERAAAPAVPRRAWRNGGCASAARAR